MRLSAIITALALSLFATTAFAQAPAPAPAPAPAEAAAPAQGDETTTGVVTFFEELARIATDTKDCGLMGASLNDYLNQNQNLLRDAAYSSSVAPMDQELAIMNAATQLGEGAGLCYQDPTVVTFFERFTKLTSELDAS